jgi:hypothetical protein
MHELIRLIEDGHRPPLVTPLADGRRARARLAGMPALAPADPA